VSAPEPGGRTRPHAEPSPADGGRRAVVCVLSSAALGGAAWSLLDFARRAHHLGIDVAVVLPQDGPLSEELGAAGVRRVVAEAPADYLELSQRTVRSAQGMLAFARGSRRWAAAIDREGTQALGRRPDVLYSDGFKAHLAAAFLRGPRHVWHVREFPPDGLGAVWRLFATALPDSTIANSRSVSDAWRLVMGPVPVVIHNGVDLDRFTVRDRTRWLHEMLALPDEARLLGMPSAFAQRKGQLLVVEAFERVAARAPDAHLVLVRGPIHDSKGERGYAESLVRRVSRASLTGSPQETLSDRIHFVRFQSRPWDLYPEFEAVVHFTTSPEPFGRVVAEAMACGVPAIAAEAGGPVEIVSPGETGWLVPPGDVAALAQAMVAALGADRDAMRAACRRRAEQSFSADRYAAEVAAVLKR
jgi:glycosyltransferase involved in cell wall biosynthesis